MGLKVSFIDASLLLLTLFLSCLPVCYSCLLRFAFLSPDFSMVFYRLPDQLAIGMIWMNLMGWAGAGAGIIRWHGL